MAAPVSWWQGWRTGQNRSRWATSPQSSDPERAALLRAGLDAQQPAFWAAVRADARITASFRSEHDDFRSRWDALGQVVRLSLITDSFFAQVCYRAKVACRVRGIPVLPHLLHHLAVTTGQISIGDHVVMEAGVYVPHGQVVVDGITHVSRGVVLRPFVTLGLGDGDRVGPRVGPRARIGTGAKAFGPVSIGAGAQVGANAVVIDDVPEGRTAVGAPAQVVP